MQPRAGFLYGAVGDVQHLLQQGRAGQGICGSLSTNPDLRPPLGWRGVKALGSSARSTAGWHSPLGSTSTAAGSQCWGSSSQRAHQAHTGSPTGSAASFPLSAHCWNKLNAHLAPSPPCQVLKRGRGVGGGGSRSVTAQGLVLHGAGTPGLFGAGGSTAGVKHSSAFMSTRLLPAAPGRAPGVEISWEFSLFPD